MKIEMRNAKSRAANRGALAAFRISVPGFHSDFGPWISDFISRPSAFQLFPLYLWPSG
jgi:hypothetical protein